MTDFNYEKLAKRIVQEQSKELWSFNDVCAALGYSDESTPVRRIIEQKGFPKPITLISGGRRKWFKKDILNWIERQRNQRSKLMLNVNQAA